MKPHIVKQHKAWNVINFDECWEARIDSVLDANDWCVRQNTKEWFAIEKNKQFVVELTQ